MTVARLSVVDGKGDHFADELPAGTQLLHGQYTITRFLNAGGFGITYLAKDSLDRAIVIKECFPAAFCRRVQTAVQARSRSHQDELEAIVRLFVLEARSLAKLVHPNIVGVHQVFEENNTAYMSLDFVEGRDLLDMVEDKDWSGDPAEITRILRQLLDAIGFVHAEGMLHRDISPDNILIQPDGNPILIDFGAAREQASKQSRILSALRVVKDGYSPQEFYISGADQAAYSDLYALGATFYHAIMRELPPDSQTRLGAVAGKGEDPYVSLVGRVKGYERNVLMSIDAALELMPKNRPQTAQEWLELLDRRRRMSRAVSRAAKPATMPAGTGAAVKPKRSKTGLLLGSVAVIALVGGLAMTQLDMGEITGSLLDPDENGASQPQALAQTEAREENAGAMPVTDTAVARPAEEPPVVAGSIAAAPIVEDVVAGLTRPDASDAGSALPARVAQPEQAPDQAPAPLQPPAPERVDSAPDTDVAPDSTGPLSTAPVSTARALPAPEERTATALADTAAPLTPPVGGDASETRPDSGLSDLRARPRPAGAELERLIYAAEALGSARLPVSEPVQPRAGRVGAISGAAAVEEPVSGALALGSTPAEVTGIARVEGQAMAADMPRTQHLGASSEVNTARTVPGEPADAAPMPDAARLADAALPSAAIARATDTAARPSSRDVATLRVVPASWLLPAPNTMLSLLPTPHAASGVAPAFGAALSLTPAFGAALGVQPDTALALRLQMGASEAVLPEPGGALALLPEMGALNVPSLAQDATAPVAPIETAPINTALSAPVAGPALALLGTEVVEPDTSGPAQSTPGGGSSGIFSAWTVDLPFSLESDVPVVSVNGVEIESLSEIEQVLRATRTLSDETEIPIAFGVRDPVLGRVDQQLVYLPVVQRVALLNGMTFESRFSGGAWRTTLVDLPADSGTDLKPGDRIVGYLPTNALIDGRTSLGDLLEEEAAQGTTLFSFAVQRDGEMWVSGFEYDAVAVSN